MLKKLLRAWLYAPLLAQIAALNEDLRNAEARKNAAIEHGDRLSQKITNHEKASRRQELQIQDLERTLRNERGYIESMKRGNYTRQSKRGHR